MENEVFINGFCKTVNAGRMITLEYVDGPQEHTLLDVDCAYGNCNFQSSCEIAKQIEEYLRK